MGTPFYLSPEICQDQPYDKKSDVWSLGVILYELCTLRRPFEAPSLPVLVMKILGGKYPPVPTRYSGPLRQLVDQCLQVEPRVRLQSTCWCLVQQKQSWLLLACRPMAYQSSE